MELGNGWYNLTTDDILENIDSAQFTHVQFTIDSNWHEFTIYKMPAQIFTWPGLFDCFETRCNEYNALN